MTPFQFGPPHRRLFGVLSASGVEGGARGAVLLLNPFGQEAIRIHRLFRTLALRLSRLGFDVLRFDYFGTGDSDGADAAGDLEGWCGDVLAADAELRRHSRGGPVVWAGSGLGASLAVLASRRLAAQDAPQRLVLWEPVIAGLQYRQQLRLKHVEALEGTYSLPDPAWRRSIDRDERAFSGEAMGFAISDALDNQMRALDLFQHLPSAAIECHVLADEADPVVSRWRRAAAGQRFTHLNETFDLAAEELRGAPLVPPLTLRAMLDAISAVAHA